MSILSVAIKLLCLLTLTPVNRSCMGQDGTQTTNR